MKLTGVASSNVIYSLFSTAIEDLFCDHHVIVKGHIRLVAHLAEPLALEN
jgi:hypothetical protein